MSNEIERDEEGKIVKHNLSSEEAARRARKRWEKDKLEKASDAQELLLDLGFDPDNPPKTAELLAETAAERGARSVQSLRQLIRMSGKYQDDEPQRKWDPDAGDACPTCGRDAPSLLDRIAAEKGLDTIEEILAWIDREDEKNKKILVTVKQLREEAGLKPIPYKHFDYGLWDEYLPDG